jgi:hypothetical protein
MTRKRTLFLALVLALLAAVVAVPGIQLAGGATERLANGSFEGGFYATPVGAVGNHWKWFTNEGQITYGYHDDTWAPVIYDGQHSQLIELNTFCRAGSDPDRYAGIYQTVAVVPGETYELSMHGMLRALEDDPDRSCCNYRVQYGIDYNGGNDWKAVPQWFELPWNTVHPRLTPGSMESYNTTVTATGSRLTLFVRVWKKWGTAQRELDVNLDAISLKGAMPVDVDEGQAKPPTSSDDGDDGDGAAPAPSAGLSVSFEPPAYPVRGWEYTIAVDASNDVGVIKLEFYDDTTLVGSVNYDVGPLSVSHDFVWEPANRGERTLKAIAYDAGGASATHQAVVTVGNRGRFLTNGSFEEGFYPTPFGEVGNGWGWFNNEGAATYGYYDETWPAVISDGAHSQLIEINTFCRAGSNPDRYSGIYQTVSGLTSGATYGLSMRGMLRALADDEDLERYNYRVVWGYTADGSTNWRDVEEWVEIPWDRVYPRTDPGRMSRYTTFFEAPSDEITIFIAAWKKWGTARKELDVNLDSIRLEGYQ